MTIKGKELIEKIKDKEYSTELLNELEKFEIKKPKTVWELEEDFTKDPNTIYISSYEIWKQCIDDIGEERIIEWIKWEDNDE